jgi:hypothetical protein
MAGFLAPLLALLKGSSTAGTALNAAAMASLLAGGLPSELVTGPKGTIRNKKALDPAQIQATYNKLIAGGMSPDQAKERLTSSLEKARPSGMQKLRRAHSRRARLGRGAMAASGLGMAAMTPLFAAQMLFPNMFMPDMEGMAAGGMGGPPTGELGELEALLGGLEQQAQGSAFSSAMGAARAQGEGGMARRMEALLGGSVPQVGMAPGLEDLIQRNRDQIAKLAVKQRPSFAQIMAQEGIFSPQETFPL